MERDINTLIRWSVRVYFQGQVFQRPKGRIEWSAVGVLGKLQFKLIELLQVRRDIDSEVTACDQREKLHMVEADDDGRNALGRLLGNRGSKENVVGFV